MGNIREACPGSPKEIFGSSGWEKHVRDQQTLGKFRHWGLKVILARVSGFGGSYNICHVRYRMCELLGRCSLFRTPHGPVSLPPALCKAPQPCVEVCWCCLLTKAYKHQSKLVNFCWYLSCCRPQLNSYHVSLGSKGSCLFVEAFCSLRKTCTSLRMKEISLSHSPQAFWIVAVWSQYVS